MRLIILFASICLSLQVLAEPFLAVENGFHCVQCHISPSGGGSRNTYGALFSQTQLPVRAMQPGNLWTGAFGERFTVGSDIRVSFRGTNVAGSDDVQNFDTDRITLYLGARISDRLSLYLDERLAPGSSVNRAAWARFNLSDHTYLRAGKFFVPFGLRLEDDFAFIRQLTNVNFNTPDNGVEIGYIRDAWRLQAAVTNGNGGAAEVDDGKQVSLFASYVQPRWRVGVSVNSNHTDFTDRTMVGLFAGLKTGPVAWLIEYDRADDRQPGAADTSLDLALAEANVRVARGHYVKLTAERLSTDSAFINDQERFSVEYQYFPLSFTQLRAGVRRYESDNPDPFLNRDEFSLQLHVFF